MANSQKGKLIVLLDYLKRESSPDHPLTGAGIRKYLNECGIGCYRGTLEDDIKYLNELECLNPEHDKERIIYQEKRGKKCPKYQAL